MEDGIGGTVKRTVWRHVRCHITTPQEYADQAKKLCQNIQVEFIAKDEIDRHAPFLDTKWKEVIAVPNSHKVHCVQAVGLENVEVAHISNEMETSFRMCRIRNDNTLVTAPAASPAATTSTSEHDIPVLNMEP